MAKKKGGKDKKKKEDEEEGGKKSPYPDTEVMQLQFDLMTAQGKLETMESRTNHYMEENKQLQKQVEDDRKKHQDIQFFLNQKLDHNYNEIERLEKALINLQSEKEMSEEAAEKRRRDETEKLQAELTHTMHELKIAEQELLKLKEFRELKDSMERKIQKMEAELASVRQDTAKQLVGLDKRRVREKEKLNEEMQRRIEETKQEAYSHSQSMLHSTTRKAQRENSMMSAELQYQSKAMEKLMHQSEALQKENTNLRQEIEMHKQMQQEFAKKTQVYQRLLKKLNDKIRVKEDRQRDNAQKMLLRDKELSDELLSTDDVIKQMNKKVEQLETSLRRTKRNNEQLRDELTRTRQFDVRQAELTDETVSLLLAAVEDVKMSMLESPGDLFGGADFAKGKKSLLPDRRRRQPTSFTELSLRGREKLIEILLHKLRTQKLELLNQAEDRANQEPIVLPPISHPGNRTMVRSASTPSGSFVAGRSVSCQTDIDGPASAHAGGMTPDVVKGALRPWGKRSKEMPMTMHSTSTYLKQGEPNSRSSWRV